MTKKILTICQLVFLGVLTAAAQKQSPPPGGPPKPFVLPAKQTFSLPNGLQVTMVPYGQVPKVLISAVIRAGNINEGREQVWLADLTADLMKEGTTARSAAQVDEEAAAMGGRITIAAEEDVTRANLDVLSEFGPRAAALLAEVVQRPLLPASELERLKADLQRQLTIQKSQPQSLALERFRHVLYGEHPYGRVFPTPEMLQKYRVEDVQKFYKENFGARRTHIYIAGVFDAVAMKKAITDAFSGWGAGDAPALNIPKPASKRTLELVERAGAPQSTLYVGLPVVDPSNPDYVQLQVMNTLLGGSFNSRITTNIREQKGYTYSPFSQLSARYRDAYWVEIADVTTEATGPSLKEIFGEIERLQKEPPTGQELKGIQNYMAGIFVIQNSSRQGVVGQLSYVDLHGLGERYLDTYVQKVYAVTPAEVQKMAQEYVAPGKMAIVVVGDKAKIADQIAPYTSGN